jgi:hypothetical protein
MDTISAICKLVLQFVGTLCKAIGEALGPLGAGILALVAGGGIAGASMTGTGPGTGPGGVPLAPTTSASASPTSTGTLDPNSIANTLITSAPQAPVQTFTDPLQVTGLPKVQLPRAINVSATQIP